MAPLTSVEIFELAAAQGLAFALRICALLTITYWCKRPWTNPRLVFDQLRFSLDLPTLLQNSRTCVVRFFFFDPELINAVKTSHVLEELLGRCLRKALTCDERILLAICMTQEGQRWSVKSADSSAVQMS